MTDRVIQAIEEGTLQQSNISFSSIREGFKENHGSQVQQELDWGKAIPSTPEQLDQYLYSYAPMVKFQWDYALQSVALPAGSLEIVDYGCGQGLASILLLDKFRSTLPRRVSGFTLIEPSEVALRRAERVLQCYCPNVRVSAIGKQLDALTESDLRFQEKAAKIHLLSNILDIDRFDLSGLLQKILDKTRRGRQVVLAVSHGRDFAGGKRRVQDALDAVRDGERKGLLSIHHDTGLKEFERPASEGKTQQHISLIVEFEVVR